MIRPPRSDRRTIAPLRARVRPVDPAARPIFHSFHKQGWGENMAGLDRSIGPDSQDGERGVPGHFVSPDLRSDCARFLDDVKSIVARRRDAKVEPPPKRGRQA
jgi:hypothetical protein